MPDLATSVPGVNKADLDAAVASMQALVPILASTAPPSVGDTSVTGAASTAARGDHTHRSSVQRDRVSVPLTSGKGSVTFLRPYPAPMDETKLIIVTEPETPDQSGYVYISNVVPGTVSETGFQVTVRKVMSSVTLPSLATSLLGFVVNIFGFATGTVNVKYVAAPVTV